MKPDGFIDFNIFYGWGIQEDYFVIECTRISGSTSGNDKNLATDYVNEGVMRFVTGTYSSGHDCAAMLGFVIDGKLQECVERVRKRLSKYCQKICLEEDWEVERGFGSQQNLFRTVRHETQQIS